MNNQDYKTIAQTVHFQTSPEQVYEALLDARRHSEFTKSKAVIFPQVNGRFEVYDGYAVGTFLKLVPGELIEATWKEVGPDWPADHYSKVRFELLAEETGTVLHFTQEEVPANRADDIADGWRENYWLPLNEYFNT